MMVLFHWYSESSNVKQLTDFFLFVKVYKNCNMRCPILRSIISHSTYVYTHTICCTRAVHEHKLI